MSSEKRRIDELLEVTSSKRIHMADYVPFGIPFYRGKEVIERAKGNAISTELFITSEQHREIKRKFGSPQDGDILLTSVGTLGVPYYVFGDGEFYFKDGNVTWFRNFKEEIDSKFLFYWLSSPATQRRLDEISIGSTQRALTISALKSLEIDLPCISTQQMIVRVLDAVTDRIALLRETNATLEAIAQALFKSWFVDFDPVHAKARGEPPQGMDDATAALFPDGFEESELGMIPKGWRVGSLAELCSISSGKRPPERTDNRTEECPIPLYGGAGLMGYTSTALFDAQRIVTGRVGTLGKVHIAYPPFWASDNVLVLTPMDISVFIFCLLWVRDIDVISLNRGSTQPLLTQRDLGAQLGVIPEQNTLAAFESVTSPIYAQIRAQEQQAQTLAQLRDTLLPKLISGQLRLPEAQVLLAEELP